MISVRPRWLIAIFRRYASLLGWLFWDAIWRFKTTALCVLIAEPLGVLFQVQAIGLAIFYARGIANDETYNFLGTEFELRTSMAALIVVGFAVFVSSFAAAAVVYFSREQAVRLGRKCEELCTARLMALWGSHVTTSPLADLPITDYTTLMRSARRDARFAALATRQLMNMFAPLLTFLVAIVVLFFIDVFLTLVVLLSMVVVVFFQAKVSLKAAALVLQFEQAVPKADDRFRQVVAWQQGFAAPFPEDEWIRDELVRSDEVRTWRTAYENRFRSTATSEFVSNGYVAFALLLIFLLLGPRIIGGKGGWELLVTYLVALRYALVNMRELATRTTALNRLYPRVQRYRQALRTLTNQRRHHVDASEIEFTLGPSSIEDSREYWQVAGGQRLGVISPFAVNRYELGLLVTSLADADEQQLDKILASVWFVTHALGRPPSAVVDRIKALEPAARKYLHKQPRLLNLWAELVQQIMSCAAQPSAIEAWDHIKDAHTIVWSLVEGLEAGSRLFFLTQPAIEALDHETREELFRLCWDKSLFFVAQDVDVDFSVYGVQAIAVVEEMSVIGIFAVEDYGSAKPRIRERFEQALIARGPRAVAGVDELELEV